MLTTWHHLALIKRILHVSAAGDTFKAFPATPVHVIAVSGDHKTHVSKVIASKSVICAIPQANMPVHAAIGMVTCSVLLTHHGMTGNDHWTLVTTA